MIIPLLSLIKDGLLYIFDGIKGAFKAILLRSRRAKGFKEAKEDLKLYGYVDLEYYRLIYDIDELDLELKLSGSRIGNFIISDELLNRIAGCVRVIADQKNQYQRMKLKVVLVSSFTVIIS